MSIDNEGSVDRAELKRLMERTLIGGAPIDCQGWYEVGELYLSLNVPLDIADQEFIAACSPAAINSLIAEIESLRKQLEDAKSEWRIAANACTLALAEQHKLKHDISALRSSREAEIERVVRLAIVTDRSSDMSLEGAVKTALAKLKEQKNG